MNITTKQRANLEKLAAWLIENADRINFNMGLFAISIKTPRCLEPSQVKHECNSVCCAVGHGPLAGIEPQPNEGWGEYAARCFTDGDEEIFFWCFGSSWNRRDNTASGAGRRIRYMLEYGVPIHKETSAIIRGLKPLPY